jgi:PAS domain S-box-containing protein
MARSKEYTALVTGASSGVGRAVACELAHKGVRLALVGRNVERLETLANELAVPARCYRVDLTHNAEIQHAADRIRKAFAHLDCLIHSAGTITMGPIATAELDAFDLQYATNLRGPFLLTQAMLPLLREGQGQVVFINSSAGLQGEANVSQYAATKHALRGVADSLRDEVNAQGIRVLTVFLGRTATPMQQAIHRMEGRAYHPDRLIQPREAAAIIVKLLDLQATAEITSITVRPFLAPQPEIDRNVENPGVMLRGPDGTIAFWNKGAERLYGWRHQETIGQTSHSLLRTRFPLPLSQIEAELERKGVWEGRLVHTRRDGKRVVVNSRWELHADAPTNRPLVLEINRMVKS